MKVITDENKIDEILNRGTIVEILPTIKEFKETLMSGKKLRFYIGFDATAPTLHLSHAKNFIFLEKIRKLGHEVIILFGDFTARIGDPSNQQATRKQLTRKEVVENVKKWKSLIKPLMDFKTKDNPPKIMYNHKWLARLNFEQIIDLASNFTVQQILERDMFRKRIEEGRVVHLHEFLYPLMQGYDSVAMDVDVEVCGTDQIFNALAGRTLLRKLKEKNKFVVALTLMENPKTGELMSKSRGTGVFLGTSPVDMYGQIMSQPDEMIEILMIHNTHLSKEEINKVIKEKTPLEAKKILAIEIIKIFYGSKKALLAQEKWQKTFSQKEIPEETEEFVCGSKCLLIDVFEKNKIVYSRGEYRRLLKGGAITNLNKKLKIESLEQTAEEGVYRVGKKKFISLKII